ncbi:hypothetical protein PENNAL_c0118G07397, partial [Penicillium nalgiovense]
ALSAIDIFLNQSSVTQSFGAFPDLARNIFRHSSEIPIPRCIRWLASAFNLTTDGLYDSDGLSQIFKAAVSPSRRMFDVATASLRVAGSLLWQVAPPMVKPAYWPITEEQARVPQTPPTSF